MQLKREQFTPPVRLLQYPAPHLPQVVRIIYIHSIDEYVVVGQRYRNFHKTAKPIRQHDHPVDADGPVKRPSALQSLSLPGLERILVDHVPEHGPVAAVAELVVLDHPHCVVVPVEIRCAKTSVGNGVLAEQLDRAAHVFAL